MHAALVGAVARGDLTPSEAGELALSLVIRWRTQRGGEDRDRRPLLDTGPPCAPGPFCYMALTVARWSCLWSRSGAAHSSLQA